MTSSQLVIVGGGGHAKVVAATARAIGIKVAGFLDDNRALERKTMVGAPWLGPIGEEVARQDTRYVLALGSNDRRASLARELTLPWSTPLVHPATMVDPTATVKDGTVVFAGAIVQPGTSIGSHVILNTACSVDHDCVIGDFAHLAPGCRLAGQVVVGQGTLVGIGAQAIQGVSIGAWAVVGAGSTLVREVAPESKVVGTPARPLH